MILLNETDLEAHLFRTILSEDWMVGTLVAKQTYVVVGDGSLAPARSKVPVFKDPKVVDDVTLPADGGYGKVGVDVLVLGSAFAATRYPVPAMLAGLTVDEHAMHVAVIGDRVWRPQFRGFVASEPSPFVEMPLTWARSFGGLARVQGSEIPHPDNPEGRGYVLDSHAAEGVALPNIEDPDRLVRSPMDHPAVCSFCPLPMSNSFIAKQLEDVDTETGEGLTKEIFNIAVPKHRLPRYVPGAAVEFFNLTPTPTRPFWLPELQVVAEVSIGSKRYEFPGEVDTLCFMPTRGELVVTHRVLFHYEYVRGRARVVRLRGSSMRAAGSLARSA